MCFVINTSTGTPTIILKANGTRVVTNKRPSKFEIPSRKNRKAKTSLFERLNPAILKPIFFSSVFFFFLVFRIFLTGLELLMSGL